ncbi:MAG TPA: carboxypeptidase-like regulatory domain-containing protein [Planctomycetota bacterium]|nr:carboxypeptidase-like regulatory domain-containing protein [Planctomycetota bacterium]
MLERVPLLVALAFALHSCTATGVQTKMVMGTVRDQTGAPIANAAVLLAPWAPWSEPELAASLPRARTDAAGYFALPISAAQMAIGSRWPGIVLQVEREGYQEWCEPVPSPLGLFDGSDVTLHPLRDEDRAVIRVERPEPGMVVLVERAGASWPSADDDRLRIWWGRCARACVPLAVPEQGELTVHVPLLPCPLMIPPCGYGMAPLGWQVRLVYPGRSSRCHAIAAGATVIFRAPQTQCATRIVRRADGTALQRLRVLLDLNGQYRWFDVSGNQVADDPLTPPQMVTAEGCAAAMWLREPSTEIVLQPLPATPREFRLVDELARPLDEVHATWCPADMEPSKLLGDSTHGEHWVVRGGHLRLDGRHATEPGQLELRSGARSAWYWEPRRGDLGDTLVVRPPGTTVDVDVEDETGSPVGDAHVLFHASGPDGMPGGTWYAPTGLPAVTDANGEVTCEGLDFHGRIEVRAFGYDFLPEYLKLGQTSIRVVGRKLAPTSLNSVDDEGRPAPFVNFGWRPSLDSDYDWHTTDSRGLATVFLPHDSPAVALQLSGRRRPDATQVVERGVRPAQIRALTAPLAMIRIPPPDAQVSVCAGNRGAPAANVVWSTLPVGTEAVLLRWAGELDYWLQSCMNQPPVLLQYSDLHEVDGLLQADRRRVTRRVALQLTGDVPAALAGLRAAPRSCFGSELREFPGNYAELDAHGNTFLAARDVYEHGVWILHPELVPASASLPSADGPGAVAVAVRRGARLTIRCRPLPTFDGCACMFLTVTSGHEVIGHGQMDLQLGRPVARWETVDLPAPFALPEGVFTARISSCNMGGRDLELRVKGTDPVTLDLDRTH